MSEFRFITSSDEHLADLPPGSRKDDYRASILKKLEYQGHIAKSFEAKCIVRGGDFFHIKPANKTTHATVSMAAEIHRKYPCPTFAIPGNHDMTHDDPESVSRQPLGVMLKSGVFRKLADEVFEIGTMKVRVVGVPYTTDLGLDTLHDMVRKRPDDQYVVAIVHALASMAPTEKIQEFFHEKIFDYRDLIFNGCPDIYMFGHYHKDQGIVDHLGTKFINVGAVSRGALTLENVDRKPKISLLTFNSQGISVEEHILPHEDANDVFDFEKKKLLEKEQKSLKEFIIQLQQNAEMAKVSTVQDRLALLQAPAEIKSKVQEILDAAEAGVLDDG